MLYRLGDFDFDITCRSSYAAKKLEPYAVPSGTPELCVEVTDKLLEVEDKISQAEQGVKFGKGSLEFTAIHRQIADWLPHRGAFVMHSAIISVGGSGVAFSAHSGTGKTTHMLLWRKLLGDKLSIINGDKPIIRFFNNEPDTAYAYGTPWNGKEGFGENSRVKLENICLIERSEQNSVELLSASDAVDLAFNQTYMPRSPEGAVATMSLMNRLLGCCRLWRIRCNMSPDAAETAYNAIFK